MPTLPEKDENLWLLAASPAIWAGHFLLAYGTVAVWCAKFAGDDASLAPARLALVAYTAVALLAVGWIGWRGYLRHRLGSASTPHEDDTPEDRHRFLGFATFLLSGLSAIAILFEALAVVFIGSCR
jgi:hypothetical protein